MKYQIGDRVVVRDDLVEMASYSMEDGSMSLKFVYDMMPCKGEVVEIVGVHGKNKPLHGTYIVQHDSIDVPESRGWTDGMFVGLAEPRVSFELPSLTGLL